MQKPTLVHNGMSLSVMGFKQKIYQDMLDGEGRGTFFRRFRYVGGIRFLSRFLESAFEIGTGQTDRRWVEGGG